MSGESGPDPQSLWSQSPNSQALGHSGGVCKKEDHARPKGEDFPGNYVIIQEPPCQGHLQYSGYPDIDLQAVSYN